MRKIIFTILCLCSQSALSNHTLLNKVKEKLSNDQIAFDQFQYLGQLHCLDRYLMNDDKKNNNFHNSYLELDFTLSPITRLFTEDGLDNTFKNFEKSYPKAKRDTQQRLDFNNYINICQNELSAEKLSNLYKKFINDLNNYHKPGEEYRNWEEEDIEQNMEDYLEYGKINYKRFL